MYMSHTHLSLTVLEVKAMLLPQPPRAGITRTCLPLSVLAVPIKIAPPPVHSVLQIRNCFINVKQTKLLLDLGLNPKHLCKSFRWTKDDAVTTSPPHASSRHRKYSQLFVTLDSTSLKMEISGSENCLSTEHVQTLFLSLFQPIECGNYL